MEAMEIDLNSDLGEGCGHDAEIIPLVTSANISCGCHAGDIYTAADALVLARQHGVTVGAHPGYADREHFGRRELTLGEDEITRLMVRQINALHVMAQRAGSAIRYVKPHGALYNQACRDDAYARPVVIAAALFDLPIVGLPNSRLEELSRGHVPFFAEGFADRRYLPDGSLVPRSQPDAFVTDPDEAVRQAERLIHDQGIRTLCVHGDNPQAVAFVQALRDALLRRGIALKAFA
jgi:5-oxoprolinase (ATP-hydrolysing) subunit A